MHYILVRLQIIYLKAISRQQISDTRSRAEFLFSSASPAPHILPLWIILHYPFNIFQKNISSPFFMQGRAESMKRLPFVRLKVVKFNRIAGNHFSFRQIPPPLHFCPAIIRLIFSLFLTPFRNRFKMYSA